MGRRVELYSTSTCPSCNLAKEFLKGQMVEFEDVDGENNEEAVFRPPTVKEKTLLCVIRWTHRYSAPQEASARQQRVKTGRNRARRSLSPGNSSG